MSIAERYLAAAGRLLIVALFLMSGVGKAMAPAATTAYIAQAGLPVPDLAYLVAVACEIGGSLLFLVGYQTRIVALVMALFTLGTALGFHTDFSNQDMWIHFWKNISIVGGFLLAASFGGGALSVDAYLARSRNAEPQR